MAGTRVKICGVTTPEVAEVAAEAGADAVGLVFAPASPRAIHTRAARDVTGGLPSSVDRVGLFVDAAEADVRAAVEHVPLTMVQLHGRWEEATLKRLAPVRICRALRFEPETAVERLREGERLATRSPHVVSVLWDTPDPERAGGTGRRFDWTALRDVLAEVRPTLPVVLAGGLHPDNVAEAVRVVRPAGVDVSSGVETRRGVKDPEKVRAFCEAARSAEPGRDDHTTMGPTWKR